MNWKKGFGISLMLIGLFISLTNKIITGAVIGETILSEKGSLGTVGLLISLMGLVFLLSVSKLKNKNPINNYKGMLRN